MLVDSASSQKINSTLRWLVNNHGTLTGNQAIVVWAIKRPEEKPVLNPQSGSFDFDDFLSPIADESKALHDDISDALNATNVQYAKIFSRVLRGYEGAEDLKKHNDPMVVVILDAATTGRLGVTFYCELQKDEYIPEGALFYQQTKRRERVKFDEDLRNMVEADFLQMHDLFSRGWTPKVKQTRSCSACSLRDLCLPELRKMKSAKAYIEERLKESGE